MAKKKKVVLVWYQDRRYQVLAVLFIIVLGFVGYNLVLDYQDKQRFEQSRNSVNTLFDKIMAESQRKPDKEITVAECGRNNLKYGEGDLGCSYSKKLIYKNADINKSNAIMNELFTLMKSSSPDNAVEPIIEKEVSGDIPNSGVRLSSDSPKIICSAGFSYYREPSSFEPLIDESNSFLLAIRCSGNARSEYYPVSN